MVYPVEYVESDERTTLYNLLHQVGTSVRNLYLETDFREYYPQTEYLNWDLFVDALLFSFRQFEESLTVLELNNRAISIGISQAGFDGPNLKFKVAFWNNTVSRFQRFREKVGNGFRALKEAIQEVLELCNIILGSAKFVTGNDSLDEIKKLGELLIKHNVPK